MTLLNPLWLAGIGAISIPIIIHLLDRQRAKRIRWAAMRFLKVVQLKSQKMMNIQHWIILAIRCLILALLALAFGGPVLKSGGALAAAVGQRNVLVILDHSGSLGDRAGQKTLLETAKQKAKEFVTKLGRTSKVAFLPLPSKEEGPLLPLLSNDPERLAKEIDALHAAPRALNFPKALETIERWMQANPVSGLEIVCFTDLQKTTWGIESSDLAARLERLGKTTRFALIDVSPGFRSRLSVGPVTVSPSRVIPGMPVQIQAKIVPFGPTPPAEANLEFWIDGQKKGTRSASIKPGEPTSLSYFHVFEAPGFHEVRVSLPEEPDAFDTSAHLAVQVRDQYRILCVNGEPGLEPRDHETFFLERALAPLMQGEEGKTTPLKPVVVSPEELLPDHFKDTELVILANVPSLRVDLVDALEQYVRNGGGLWVALGHSVEMESWNEAFYKDGHGLLPARLADTQGETGRRRNPALDQRWEAEDRRHPMLALFFSSENWTHLFSSPTFQRYVELEPVPDASVVVRFDRSRHPALVEKLFGRGTVLLFASTVDADWTTLPTHKMWIPFLDQVASYLMKGKDGRYQQTWGNPIEWPLPPEAEGKALSALTPDGKRLGVQAKPKDGGLVAWLERSEDVGFYRLEWPGEKIVVAVNPDLTEADPTPVDEVELKRLYPGWPVTIEKESAKTQALRGDVDLWKPVLGLVLFLLAMESFLAWKFGNAKKTPGA